MAILMVRKIITITINMIDQIGIIDSFDKNTYKSKMLILKNVKLNKKTAPRCCFFKCYCNINYPPKSSNRIFSSAKPKSSPIFCTALFIIGGPQK